MNIYDNNNKQEIKFEEEFMAASHATNRPQTSVYLLSYYNDLCTLGLYDMLIYAEAVLILRQNSLTVIFVIVP